MHRPSQPAGRAGDARPGLRFRRGCLRCDLRHLAHDDALHRARHSPPVVGMDPARAGRRRRYPRRRRTRPRQPAQHQEHAEHAEGGATQRPARRFIVSIRSACRSGRKSTRADSPRPSRAPPIASIPFDSRMFGTAANNGQMIAEISAEPPHHQDVPADGATADRPWREPRSARLLLRQSSGSCGPKDSAANSIEVQKTLQSDLRSSKGQSLEPMARRRAVLSTPFRVPVATATRLELGDIRLPPARAAGLPSQGFRPRPCGPAGRPRVPGSAARADRRRRGYRRGARPPPPSAVPLKERRKGRDWTAPTARPARFAARWHNIAALPRGGRVGRVRRLGPREFANRDRRGMGTAEHVEGLLEIAVVRQRPAVTGQQRLVAGMSNRWPARARRPPGSAAPWRAAPCRMQARRRRRSGLARKRSR